MDRDPQEVEVFGTEVQWSQVTDRPTLIETPAGKLALLKRGDEVVAIDAWCPHLDGPLWEGTTSQEEIACPWHRWRYSLRTGQCTWAPRGDMEEAAETEIRILGVLKAPNGRCAVEIPVES